MNAEQIIQYIANAEKKTPVKITIQEKEPLDYGSAKVFGTGAKIVFGDWKELGPILEPMPTRSRIWWWRTTAGNSAIPLLDLKGINARIEPGASSESRWRSATRRSS